MMIMSTPSSSFHKCSAMESVLPKIDSLSPILSHEDPSEQSYDSQHGHPNSSTGSTVKRPMNAFLLWARGERKRVSSDGCGVSQTSLSKLLGETWRQMPVEDKQPFLDMAESLKKQHHRDHPDYRFKPKQRPTTANKTIVKKHHAPALHRQLSSMHSLDHSQAAVTSASASTATPHPIQSAVLAMCQAIIPPPSSFSEDSYDWFLRLTGQAQPVIVAPLPRSQTSPVSSRRAVRIQIINKHDDIALPPATSLPMTPPPLSSSLSTSASSIIVDESTPTLSDYLTDDGAMFSLPTDTTDPPGLTALMNASLEYGTFHESSMHHFTDLDQHYDSSGWIDTPLSNFCTNSTDVIPSAYESYDFLSL